MKLKVYSKTKSYETGVRFIGEIAINYGKGIYDRERIYEIDGKLYSDGSVVYTRFMDAMKSMGKTGGLVITLPNGYKHMILYKGRILRKWNYKKGG